MKKMIALLLAALMVFALAACAANQTPADAQTEAPTQQTEAPPEAQAPGGRKVFVFLFTLLRSQFRPQQFPQRSRSQPRRKLPPHPGLSIPYR